MRERALGATLICAAVALSTVAQTNEDLTVEVAFEMDLEELMTVSIATGTPRGLAEAPAIATVITAEDIRASGATDLDQVLESVPGLHVSRTHMAYNPLYVMRGLHSETSPYVLFLMNGIPMTLWASGNLGELWGGMPVEAISRIEVIRGPGSAVFGADAVGGVVNIVTKSAEEIGGTEAGVRAGSFDTREAWVLHGSQTGGVDIALALQLWSTDGQRETVAADVQTGFDQIFRTRASLAPGPVSTGGDGVEANLDLARGAWRLRLGFQGRFDLGAGAGFIQALDPEGTIDRRRHTGDLTWRRQIPDSRWDLEARASYLRDRGESDIFSAPAGFFDGRAFFPRGIHLAITSIESQRHLQTTATYGGAGHRLRLGVGDIDIDFDDVGSKRNVDVMGLPLPGGFQDVSDDPGLTFGLGRRRDVRFAFVQDEWELNPRWDLTLGVRGDHYSDFGDTINPRLALVWKASDRVTAKLLYGRAFRPPSYREQYLINNSELLGNPDLEPEVMNTVELGLSMRVNPACGGSINFFAYELDDLILPMGPAPNVYRNVGQRTGEGFEVEGDWQPGKRLRFRGSYAYQQSTDDLTGADAGHAPQQQLQARADWSFAGGWRLYAAANVVADRARVAGDARSPIGDDVTVDLTLRREKLGHFDVGLLVRNLFDEDVREPSSYIPGFPRRFIPGDLPQAGRAVFVELRYRP